MTAMSTNIYFNNGGGDEQYTLKETVELLLPYIQHLKKSIIWCPFDKDDSQFVIVLKENGFKIVNSHIHYGQDFFEYEPKQWDIIISNPPYKNKRLYWERCLSFNKPFTLLLPINILSDSLINKTTSNRNFQLLIPQKRHKFYNANTGKIEKKITFKAAYFGVDIFKKEIILENIDKNER